MHNARAGIEQGQSITGRLTSKVRRALHKLPRNRSEVELQLLTRYISQYWKGQDDPLRQIPDVYKVHLARYLGYKKVPPGGVVMAAGAKTSTVYVVLSGEIVISTYQVCIPLPPPPSLSFANILSLIVSVRPWVRCLLSAVGGAGYAASGRVIWRNGIDREPNRPPGADDSSRAAHATDAYEGID
jgi:hypothetical protein